jgi:hypothetical protein
MRYLLPTALFFAAHLLQANAHVGLFHPPATLRVTVWRNSEQRYSFQVGFDDSLHSFREKIRELSGLPPSYYNLRSFQNSENTAKIYCNDSNDISLRELFTTYHPKTLITQEMHFLMDLGPMSKRVGRALLTDDDAETINNSDQTPDELICPITYEVIYNAIKINNHFYELFPMCEYLANEYIKYRQDCENLGKQNCAMYCPLRNIIAEELIVAIDTFYNRAAKVKIEKSSMYYIVEDSPFSQRAAQLEYDQLLLAYNRSRKMIADDANEHIDTEPRGDSADGAKASDVEMNPRPAKKPKTNRKATLLKAIRSIPNRFRSLID